MKYTNNFNELSTEELASTNGGAWPVVVAVLGVLILADDVYQAGKSFVHGVSDGFNAR
jgi:lactobin A/cerein 7B family class IIb bacteriocin